MSNVALGYFLNFGYMLTASRMHGVEILDDGKHFKRNLFMHDIIDENCAVQGCLSHWWKGLSCGYVPVGVCEAHAVPSTP